MNKKVSILINSLYSGGAETVVLAILRKIKFNQPFTLILLENIIFYDIPQNIKVVYLSKKVPQSGILKLIMLPVLSYRLKICPAESLLSYTLTSSILPVKGSVPLERAPIVKLSSEADE